MPDQEIQTDDEIEIIRIAEAAITAVKQTFDRWMEIARALEIGRRYALDEARTNDVTSRAYGKAFSHWLQRHPRLDNKNVIPGSTRKWLFACYDHLPEITACAGSARTRSRDTISPRSFSNAGPRSNDPNC
jgi:hypothetical protein